MLSIRFINDPRRLKLLRIDRSGEQPMAVFRNEIGEEFSAGIGSGVARGTGLGRGRIDRDSVHVIEDGIDHETEYVFSTRGSVRRLAVHRR